MNIKKLIKSEKYTTRASILIFLSSILTIVFVFSFDASKVILIGVVIYLFLAYFVYKRRKWAIIAVMLFFTFDKIVQGAEDPNMTKGLFFWWIAFMSVFWAAHKEISENAKKVKNEISREHKKINEQEEINPKKNIKMINFSILLASFSIFFLMVGVLFYLFYFKPKKDTENLVYEELKQRENLEKEYLEKRISDCRLYGEKVETRLNSEREKDIQEGNNLKIDVFGFNFFEYSFYAPLDDKCVYVTRHILFGDFADESAYLVYDYDTNNLIRRFKIASQIEEYKKFIKEYSDEAVVLKF